MRRWVLAAAFAFLSPLAALAEMADRDFSLPAPGEQAASAHALSFCRLTAANLIKLSQAQTPELVSWQQSILATRDQSHAVLKAHLSTADYTAFAERFQHEAGALTRDLASAAGRQVDIRAFNKACEQRMLVFASAFDQKIPPSAASEPAREIVAVTPAPQITKTKAMLTPVTEAEIPAASAAAAPSTAYALALCEVVRIENLKANPETSATLREEEKEAVAKRLKEVEGQVIQSLGEAKRQELYYAFSHEILEPLNGEIQAGSLKTIGEVTRQCTERATQFGQARDQGASPLPPS